MKLFRCFRGSSPAIRRSQPTRRRIRQRQAATKRRPPSHRRTFPSRHPTMRYLKTAPSLPRMRFQNLSSLPRNGFHPPRSYRRLETPRNHSQSSRLHQRAQAEGPGDLRLGNQRQAAIRWSLRQIQRAFSQLDQQDIEE